MEELMRRHRDFMASRKSYGVEYRLRALDRMQEAIRHYEDEICRAVYQDLGKARSESYMCEVGLTLKELSHVKRHLKSWARTKYVGTGLANFPASSRIVQEPYGVVLIMSPWNYPFMLCMEPLVGAVAAGNSVVLKPSNYSPATSAVIKKVVERAFEAGHVSVVEGGRAENTALLEQKFDYIFFTGSKKVGRLVMEKAAKHLTPVSLELGGKSPCVVDRTANLRMAAKRLAYGKYLNCGQTCVAPDYLLIDEAVKDEFLGYYRRAVVRMYGENPLDNPDYGRIINEKHFQRLCGLVDAERVVLGGRTEPDKLRMEPTVMDRVTAEDAIMQEEIFGPILPVLTFHSMDEAERFVLAGPKPLACYVFTSDPAVERRFLRYVSFGGGCINDTIAHLVSQNMGFGGVGDSGMGSYHGKRSFQTFSHEKSVLKKSMLVDMPMRYQPYKKVYTNIVKLIMH